MPEKCKESFPNCVYIERNADLSRENMELKAALSLADASVARLEKKLDKLFLLVKLLGKEN